MIRRRFCLWALATMLVAVSGAAILVCTQSRGSGQAPFGTIWHDILSLFAGCDRKLPLGDSPYQAEQRDLFVSLSQRRCDREAVRLLKRLVSSDDGTRVVRRLAWWGTVPARGGSPLRVHLFDVWLAIPPERQEPLICVVTDDERHFLFWCTMAEKGKNLLSVETRVRETPSVLVVRSSSIAGNFTYRYSVSAWGVRPLGVTRTFHNLEEECGRIRGSGG